MPKILQVLLALMPLYIKADSSSQVPAGKRVVLSVTADGTPPFTYQWKHGAVAAGTDQTLILPSMRAADAGDYSVVVSNSAGSTTSDVAHLTVAVAAPPPLINYFESVGGAWASSNTPVTLRWSTSNGTATLTDPNLKTIVLSADGNLKITTGGDGITWTLAVTNVDNQTIRRVVNLHGSLDASQLAPLPTPPTRLQLEQQAATAAGAQFDSLTDRFSGTADQIHKLHTELSARGL